MATAASAALWLPSMALAQSNAVQQGLGAPGLQTMFGGGLAANQSLEQLIVNVIGLLLLFSGIIAVLFIIIGGFWYITAQGNDEQAEKGRKALTNAIIGIVIIAMAYAIIYVVQNTITGAVTGY